MKKLTRGLVARVLAGSLLQDKLKTEAIEIVDIVEYAKSGPNEMPMRTNLLGPEKRAIMILGMLRDLSIRVAAFTKEARKIYHY